MSFTLDTSGAICIETARDHASVATQLVRWSDLTPFVMGYVEALFASLRGDEGPDTTEALRRIRDADRGVHNRPLLSESGKKALRERCHWSRTHNWPMVADMMREIGLVAVVGQVDGGKITEPTELGRAVLPFLLAFSDLDPSALALILRDCEAYCAGHHRKGVANSEVEGGSFWRIRQAAGYIRDGRFAPLQPYLSDEGRVCLKEAA